jgi:hypothetical protein
MVRSVALALVLATASCTHAQAPKARLAGEIMALVGVAGLIAAGVIAKTTSLEPSELALGSGLVSIVGIGTFAAGDLTGGDDGPSAVTRHRWAKTWMERAKAAAIAGNCERVQSIAPRVRRLDPDRFELEFIRDPEIAKCLMPGD